MVKLYVLGAAEAVEQVTVPAAPTAGVVQLQPTPGPVTLTNVRPAGNGSDSEALVAVPVLTVSAIEYVMLFPITTDAGDPDAATARTGVGAATVRLKVAVAVTLLASVTVTV